MTRSGDRLHPILTLGLGLYWVAFAVASHWPRLDLKAPGVEVPSPSLDKLAHLVGFGGLTILLLASGVGAWVWRRIGGRGPTAWWPWLGSVLVAFAYAVGDEFSQDFVAGRTMSLKDLAADAAGMAAGLAVGWWAWRWWRTELGEARAAQVPEDTEHQHGPSETPATDEKNSDGGGFVGHAALVSGLTLVSRFTGLVRDAVLLAIFGASQTMSAFFFGFMVPNLFRRLFGEGALTAAFLPRYRRLLDDDPGLAKRYAVACGWRVTVVLLVLVLVGEVVLLGLLFGSGLSEKAALAVRLTAVMLPYAPLICGTAFLGAVLQAQGRFGPGAVAPVALNLGMIAASAVAAWWSPDDVTRATVVAVGVLVCGVIQVGGVAGALRLGSVEGDAATEPSAGTSNETLSGVMRATLVAMGPMVVGLGVFQINTLTDGLIAYGLSAPEIPEAVPAEASMMEPPPGETLSVNGSGPPTPSGLELFGGTVEYPVGPGAMATLTAAQRLYQFPLGVFGIAIATAIFPALAAAGRDGQRGEFSAIVRRGVRLTWFIGLPATVGLLLVREPVVRVMFERGAFDREDSAAVSWVLLGYGAGVWAYSLTHVLTRAFYARDDAMTPLKVAGGMVAVNLALNLTLVWPLGVAGLAWSTAVSATMQCVVLLTLMQKHADAPVGAGVAAAMAKSTAAVAVMAAALVAVLVASPPAKLNVAGAFALLAVMVPTGGVVFVVTAMALRCEELRWLVKARSD